MIEERPSFRDVFGAFTFYFFAQLLLIPVAAQVAHRVYAGQWTGAVEWVGSSAVRPWINLMMVAILFMTITVYTFRIEKGSLKQIWGKFLTPASLPLKALGYWCLAYPCLLIISNMSHSLLSRWITFPVVDQIAVQQVRLSQSDPVLYMLTALSIVTLVPFVEEVLFRGFLQQYLKNHLSVFASVVVTAVVFAFFHFSMEQGWTNVELIAALFTFSLFLGYIREKSQSLNGSILLHGIFNGMSLLFMSLQQ